MTPPDKPLTDALGRARKPTQTAALIAQHLPEGIITTRASARIPQALQALWERMDSTQRGRIITNALRTNPQTSRQAHLTTALHDALTVTWVDSNGDITTARRATINEPFNVPLNNGGFHTDERILIQRDARNEITITNTTNTNGQNAIHARKRQ